MKVVYNRFSDFTQNDLQAAEQAVVDAQMYWNERKEAYERAVITAGEGWAKRNKLPLVEQAEKQLKTAQEYYSNVLSALQTGQEIEITGSVASTLTSPSNAPETSKINWSLIGLAAGAIILLIVILKVL